MKRSHVSIIAVLASLGGAMVAVPAISQSSGEPTVAAAAGGAVIPAHFGARFHHGWRGGWGGGHRFGRLCGEERAERIDRVIGFVEGFMEFTPEQQRTWGDLKTAVRASNAKVDEACGTLAEREAPGTLPQRLARLETMMSAGLAVVHDVRPAFEAFYASLSEKQQHALDELVARGHRH